MQTDRFARFGIFGGGVFFTVVGLANPFFTLYAAELGASTLAIGLLVTLRAVLPIVIAMPAGQLIDTVGPMRMLSLGSGCLLASLLCTVLAQGIPLLAISQVLLGVAIIVSASSLQVLVAKGARDKRNDAIKRYSMWMSGGGMVGPLIGGVIATLFEVPLDGYRAAFVASSVATGVFLAAVLYLARRYAHSPAEGGPAVREVLSARGVLDSYKRGIDLTSHRPVQFGLIGTFLIMYIQALYMSFLPLF
ncbi:MFS transporter [Marivita sp.]|uniref:MFS transporter n=1 Tax=Marivita sp. TaxID=2003365 RepID=UPI0025BB4E98|nr:MFS transporter [Marivita sp.]